MPDLKGFQKRYLRGRAHNLKPVVLVGQKGVSEELIRSVDEALTAHELIKVRFNENKKKPQKLAMSDEIRLKTGCAVAGMVGHTVILYRPNPDPDKRRVRLPESVEAIASL